MLLLYLLLLYTFYKQSKLETHVANLVYYYKLEQIRHFFTFRKKNHFGSSYNKREQYALCLALCTGKYKRFRTVIQKALRSVASQGLHIRRYLRVLRIPCGYIQVVKFGIVAPEVREPELVLASILNTALVRSLWTVTYYNTISLT